MVAAVVEMSDQLPFLAITAELIELLFPGKLKAKRLDTPLKPDKKGKVEMLFAFTRDLKD